MEVLGKYLNILDWSNKEFPVVESLISLDAAYDILFKDIGMELRYISPEIRYIGRH